MKKNTNDIKVGSIISKEDAIENQIEIVSQKEFDKIETEAKRKYNDFISVEDWRKYIEWKTISIIKYAVITEDEQGKVLIQCVTNYDCKVSSIIRNQKNLDALFAYHPLLNSFKYDKFTNKKEFNGVEYDEDTKPAEIFNFFRRTFDEWCPRYDIKETIQERLNINTYDSALQYFETIMWDGEERLETFLIDNFDAPDTKLNRTYFKRWMIALVKRQYEPAAKFDNMLILAGEHGKSKTSIFEWLGNVDNHNYYVEAPDDLKDINTLIYTSIGKFIINFDDFDDICTKGDIGKIKAFITNRTKTAALKWQHQKDYPVRYVLGGTTNRTDILVDDTSMRERRFWVVKIDPKNDAFVLDDNIREQLYAEAVYLYKNDPKQKLWIYENELIDDENNLQQQYKKASNDPMIDKIMSIFNRQYPIVDGKFDNFNHFQRCMEQYNPIYNKTLTPEEIQREQEKFGNLYLNDEYSWNFVKQIPSGWVINLFNFGQRSTDRIITILQTQNMNAYKKPKVFMYDCYMTHIFIENR